MKGLFPFINWRYYAGALSLDSSTERRFIVRISPNAATGHEFEHPSFLHCKYILRMRRTIRKAGVEHSSLRPALTSECEPPVWGDVDRREHVTLSTPAQGGTMNLRSVMSVLRRFPKQCCGLFCINTVTRTSPRVKLT